MREIGIGCVVEGEGDQAALPILLRRLVREISGDTILPYIPKPIRTHRHSVLRVKAGKLTVDAHEIGRAVDAAMRNVARVEERFALVLLDADDDLPCEAAPLLLDALRNTHGHIQCSVVLPTKEFESWFIASMLSLRGRCGLPEDIEIPRDAETVGAKGRLSHYMKRAGRKYTETVDQAKLAAAFDLRAARQAKSFDKLWRDMERLISERAGAD